MPSTFSSQVIDAPIDEVWELTRPFDSFEVWHPLCTRCDIVDDEPSDRVGVVRDFVMADDHIQEQLVALSDVDHSWKYTIADIEYPVEDYIGEFRLEEITQGSQAGKTFAVWTSSFEAPDEEAEAITGAASQVYEEGLKGIQEYLKNP